ncbi:MAG: hypothetical protein HN576_09050 [Bacteriovoracaceae bacterium]|jgi:hypothetical protein|nr:hypothetical protein [Bacteriovoracaceae bacterium]
MKILIILVLLVSLQNTNAQDLSSRLGVDTGGGSTSGRIISFQENGSLETLRVRAIPARRRLGRNSLERANTLIPYLSVDLNTVSEITLKDGTVIKNDEVKELLLKRIELLNKD